jgi:uncharacterized protein (DUF302 family)
MPLVRSWLFGLLCLFSIATGAAQEPLPPFNPWVFWGNVQPIPSAAVQPGWNFFDNLNTAPQRPAGAFYWVSPAMTPIQKRQIAQMSMPVMTNLMRMSLTDFINFFTVKYKAKQGLSFDDVVESMKLRANKVNFKLVGEQHMWKDFRVVLQDQDAPRAEVFSFCDIAVARELLKISPEFIILLPCRIAVMEDGQKNVWLMMLDWNLDWVDGYQQALGMTPDLWKGALDVHRRMHEIMKAGANGDL